MQVPRHRTQGREHGRHRSYLAITASVAVITGVLVAGVLGFGWLRGPDSGSATQAAARVTHAPCSAGPAGTCAGISGSPGGVATPARSQHQATPTPTVAARRSSRPVAVPAPASSSAAPSGAAPGTGTTDASATASVLAFINQARAQAGLPAYTVSSGLQTSSGRHNQLMASGCGLSHQCPGEPSLGSRETAAGVSWTAAGENIGEGGPVADTTTAITAMAVTLTQDMLNEKPPDDGHRLNLLSSTFGRIGIAIYRGSDGTVWMTQDFAN